MLYCKKASGTIISSTEIVYSHMQSLNYTAAFEIWHHWLGHLGVKRTKKILKNSFTIL